MFAGRQQHFEFRLRGWLVLIGCKQCFDCDWIRLCGKRLANLRVQLLTPGLRLATGMLRNLVPSAVFLN